MNLKKNSRGFLFLLGAVAILATLAAFSVPREKTENVSLSRLIDQAKTDKLSKIQVEGTKLTGTLKDKDAPLQVAYKDSPTASLTTDYGIDPTRVNIEPKESGDSNFWLSALIGIIPIVIIIGFFYFMMRQAQGQGNQAMNFGKSRARLFGADKSKVTFKEVAGADEAKQELTEIVEFLKFPSKFEALGAKIPKGVLLFGPPGTGKTMLARAVAGEAGVPFFSISGSEFVEMFVGVGASRVRDLFMKAKKNAPCIIFIDEIDAVGRQRGTGMGGGHDEREQTLNQILVEMDGFEQGTNVIVMAATNRADVLDPALLRPGRFDRRVTLDSPDLKSRKAILAVHSEGKPFEKAVDMDEIASKTPGFSGADLANLVNEAAIAAARADRKSINQFDLNSSVEKVLMGPERKTHVMNSEEKEITAYHEAGHAIVAHILPYCDPVNKISIISRGRAGGFTWTLPETEQNLSSIADFKDDLAQALGGRLAEQVVFGDDHVTTGASNDLQKATQLARHMVMDYGMSAKLPNRVFGSQSDQVFIGRDMGQTQGYSEEVAKIIDEEVAALIAEATRRAGEVVRAHRADVDKIAAKLVKDEVIDQAQLYELIGPRPNKRPTREDPRRNMKVRDGQNIGPDVPGDPATA